MSSHPSGELIPPPVPRRRRVRAFFFGHDIFISYRRSDGTKYALALFNQLKDKFTVYADWRAALPGTKVPKEVAAALRNSSMLVVIGTPEALASDPIAEEVAMWSPTRSAVQVDIGGVLANAEETGSLWPAIQGSPRISEDASILKGEKPPQPSADVVAFIEDCATFTKQESRLRRSVIATIASIVLMLAAGVGAAWWLTSTTQEKIATENAKSAIRLLRAQRQVGAAQRKTQEAARERERQAEIAAALQLASESSDLLRQQPHRVTHAASLAVQSVRRLGKLGIREAAADSAIRAAAAVLPIVQRRVIPWKNAPSPAITADGRFAAYVSGPHEVSVADLDKPAALRRFKLDRAGSVERLAVSADGTHVAATSLGRVWIWPEERELETELVWTLAFSNDNKYLAVASGKDDSTVSIEVFEVATASKTAKPLKATSWLHEGPGSRISFTRLDETIVVHDGSHPAIWRWREDKTYPAPKGTRKIELSPVDEELALALGQDSVNLWQWRQWNEPDASPRWNQSLRHPRDAVFGAGGYDLWIITDFMQVRRAAIGENTSVTLYEAEDLPPAHAIASSGGYIILFAQDDTVRFYRGRTEIGRSGGSRTEAMAVSMDGHATWCSVAGVERWGAPPEVQQPVSVSTWALHALSPDGTRSAAFDATASLLSVFTDAILPTTYAVPAKVTAIAFSPRGQLLAGSDDGRVYVWPPPLDASSQPRRYDRAAPVTAIAVSPSGKQVAVVTGKVVSLCDFANGVLAKRCSSMEHPVRVTEVAFGAGDALLATASDDKRLRLWKGGHAVREYSIAGVHEIAFGGRDRYVAAVTANGVAVWDTTAVSDDPARIPVNGAQSVAFDATGDFIATGGSAQVVVAWQWRNQIVVVRAPARSEIAYVRFTPDGKTLKAFSRLGAGVTLSWSNDAIAADVCRRLRDADAAAFREACTL